MKKEYVKPTISIIELNCAGMLCMSGTPNFDDADTDEMYVGEDEWDGTVL